MVDIFFVVFALTNKDTADTVTYLLVSVTFCPLDEFLDM